MPIFFLVAFILVPIAEIALFVKVGGEIGLFPTLGVVIATAVAGTALLRHQGLAVLRRVEESLQRQEFPMAEVFDGLCLLVAGALLLTPGFLTDTVGLLLFVPSVRRFVRHTAGRWLLRSGRVKVWTDAGPGPGPGPGPGTGPQSGPKGAPVIEGEYRDLDDAPRRPGSGDSPWKPK